MLARAIAKQTNAIFLKLAGPELVQKFIGDGARVRLNVKLDDKRCILIGQGENRKRKEKWCNNLHR